MATLKDDMSKGQAARLYLLILSPKVAVCIETHYQRGNLPVSKHPLMHMHGTSSIRSRHDGSHEELVKKVAGYNIHSSQQVTGFL